MRTTASLSLLGKKSSNVMQFLGSDVVRFSILPFLNPWEKMRFCLSSKAMMTELVTTSTVQEDRKVMEIVLRNKMAYFLDIFVRSSRRTFIRCFVDLLDLDRTYELSQRSFFPVSSKMMVKYLLDRVVSKEECFYCTEYYANGTRERRIYERLRVMYEEADVSFPSRQRWMQFMEEMEATFYDSLVVVWGKKRQKVNLRTLLAANAAP